jgi:hypothetical protein
VLCAGRRPPSAAHRTTQADVSKATPQNLAGPQSGEASRISRREAFLAPARRYESPKRKAFAGAEPVSGELSMITTARNRAPRVLCGTELRPQYITIDLKKRSTIYAVLVWHYHKQPRVYKSVIVQIAEDADFIENVRPSSTTISTNRRDRHRNQQELHRNGRRQAHRSERCRGAVRSVSTQTETT